MKVISYALTSATVALLACLTPGSLLAQPIIVTINDVPNGAPVIQVQGAPNGYDIYTGDLVNDPTSEDGALITLFGVNNYYSDPEAALPDWGGRFRDSTPWQCLPPWEPFGGGVDYRQYRTAVDIVWVEHDYGDEINGYYGPFYNGDLRVGFNSAFPGIWWMNGGILNADVDLGPVTDDWVTVYANDMLVVRFKPHTYVAKGFVPFDGSLEVVAGQAMPAPELPDNPNAFTRDYEGEGWATHLGRLRISMSLTIYPDQVSEPYTDPRGYSGVALPYEGTANLIAANGDTITCRVTGIEGLTLPPWWLDGDLRIIEGTGRFEGARGYMTFTGLEADTITVAFDGTMSSIGKNKK